MKPFAIDLYAGLGGWAEGLMAAGYRVVGFDSSIGYEREHPDAFGWKKPGTSSRSPARKAASALIAKIPFVLAEWIGRAWYPQPDEIDSSSPAEVA